MSKWRYFLLAVGSWVAGAWLIDAKVLPPVSIVFVSAVGWFFIMLVFGGGEKGLAWGIPIFFFVICALIFEWSVSHLPGLLGYQNWKIMCDTLPAKPLSLLGVSLRVMLGLIVVIAVPVFVGTKIWKVVTKKEPEEKEKIRGWEKVY